MTEYEKMQRGLPYTCTADPRIMTELERARTLCARYNRLPVKAKARRLKLLTKMLGRIGDNAAVLSPFFCDYGTHLSVGDNFFANYNLTVLDCAQVTIGSNVFIAPNCTITTAGHALDAPGRDAWLEFAYPVNIGNSVWIGANVTILPGVTIGDRTVIGAGSVVTRDIPSDVIAVGNPCRVLRAVTDADRDRYNVPPEKFNFSKD